MQETQVISSLVEVIIVWPRVSRAAMQESGCNLGTSQGQEKLG